MTSNERDESGGLQRKLDRVAHRIRSEGKVPAAIFAISFVEFGVAMFLFLLPGSWEVVDSAVAAVMFSVTMPRSYAIVAFVTIVNIGLYRYAAIYSGGTR